MMATNDCYHPLAEQSRLDVSSKCSKRLAGPRILGPYLICRSVSPLTQPEAEPIVVGAGLIGNQLKGECRVR
jgi:hypothetical protein